jgi:hypothetical protein
MAGAPRSTPVRTDWPRDSRICGGALPGSNPLLAKCASTLASAASLGGGPSLPSGWRRDVSEDTGAPVVVLPPADHPFWRSYDCARQTTAMFAQVAQEKEALAAELTTTLVRRGCVFAGRLGVKSVVEG